MQELRMATDFALRSSKVTARSLGRAMSTIVVQERHLWLNLAEMKDVDAGNPEMLEFALSQETARTAPLLHMEEGWEENPVFIFISVPPTFWYPFSQRKSNFLFLRVFRTMERQCVTSCFLTLAHKPFCQQPKERSSGMQYLPTYL